VVDLNQRITSSVSAHAQETFEIVQTPTSRSDADSYCRDFQVKLESVDSFENSSEFK